MNPHDGTIRPRWRGEQFGLPAEGKGSAAPLGRRLGGFVLDIVFAAFIGSMLPQQYFPAESAGTVVWLIITVCPVAIWGFTPGMTISRIGVVRLDGKPMVGLPKAFIRGLLTLALIPALIWDFDGRAWHDRLSGTIVVNR